MEDYSFLFGERGQGCVGAKRGEDLVHQAGTECDP